MICIVYVTKKGKIKISVADEIRIMGRLAKGMIGMNLDVDDEVVSSFIIDRDIEPKPSPVLEPETSTPTSAPVQKVITKEGVEEEEEERIDGHGSKPFPG